jgi:hypothetical protein
MTKRFALAVAWVACVLFLTGCEAAKDAASKEGAKAKETANKVMDEASKKLSEAKEGVLKPITEMLPKIQEKISALTGDKAKDAQAKFEEFKKLLEEYKGSAGEKAGELKDKLLKAFEDLKKMVGM